MITLDVKDKNVVQVPSGYGNFVSVVNVGDVKYQAGDNIEIDEDSGLISVTGITSYTGITGQEVKEALGYTPTSEDDLVPYAKKEWVYGKDYADKAYVNEKISAASATTTGEVQTMIETALEPYATEEWVEGKISAASATTTGEVQTMIETALEPYYTAEQTDSAIATALTKYAKVWSGTIVEFEQIEEKDPDTIYIIKSI